VKDILIWWQGSKGFENSNIFIFPFKDTHILSEQDNGKLVIDEVIITLRTKTNKKGKFEKKE
jgi:hypothetical protein